MTIPLLDGVRTFQYRQNHAKRVLDINPLLQYIMSNFGANFVKFSECNAFQYCPEPVLVWDGPTPWRARSGLETT